ncbi:MAG: cupin protein [Gammaproteobacteria bacterium]|jgi:uncharacterized cupin superfamily protein|nr:cupin protein [Gammaproteobacteria bacterium]
MIKVIHEQAIPWKSQISGEFSYERKSLTQHSDGKKLGMSIFRLKPGKKAFPLHAHYANEEATYVLQGCGEVRGLDTKQTITAGDYVVFPTGRDNAHQIINNSD